MGAGRARAEPVLGAAAHHRRAACAVPSRAAAIIRLMKGDSSQGHVTPGPQHGAARLVAYDRDSGLIIIDARRILRLLAVALRSLRPKRRPLTSAEYDARFGVMPEHLTDRAVLARHGLEPITEEEARQMTCHLPTDGEG